MGKIQKIEGQLVEAFGTVKKVLYQKNGFLAALFQEKETKKWITITGCMDAGEKDKIIIRGKVTKNKKYGWQVEVLEWERPKPTTESQSIELLSSGLIKGCGKKKAKDIVEALGANAVEIILEKGEEVLLGIRGIGKKSAQAIAESVRDSYGAQITVKHLAKYGILPETTIRAYQKLKSKTIEQVSNNPYVLTGLNLLNFRQVDHIAIHNMGISMEAQCRIEAGMLHVLKAEYMQGHCYTFKRALIESTAHFLQIQEPCVEKALSLITGSTLVVIGKKVYIKTLYEAETYSAQKMAELLAANGPSMPKNRVEQELAKYQKEKAIILNQTQKDAIIQFLTRHNIMVLTGGPGTGKTVIARAVAEIYGRIYKSHKIAICAPTGRASQNISKEGQTIHRLLGLGVKSDDSEGIDMQALPAAEKDESNPLVENLIIIDEASMLDIEMLYALLKATLKGTKILFVGDHNQLPSVGPGSVLQDLIKTVPYIELTEIYRQAKNSGIIKNAHSIIHDQKIELNPGTRDFFFLEKNDHISAQLTILASVKRLLDLGYKPTDILVLSPIKKGLLGTIELNEKIRNIINPPDKNKKELTVGDKNFRAGDLIIQNAKNSVEKGLYNGNTGIVLDICTDPENSQNTELGLLCEINGEIKFLDPETIRKYEFNTAYCITVHKAQGGQAKAVIMPVVCGHERMLTRNLLYTSISRAMEMLVLIGERKAVFEAIKNTYQNNRRRCLAELILEKQKLNERRILSENRI